MDNEKGDDSPYENGLEHVKEIEREKIIIKRKRKTMGESKSTAVYNVH